MGRDDAKPDSGEHGEPCTEATDTEVKVAIEEAEDVEEDDSLVIGS
ncbi:hypothetical protein [Natronosalvus vescus]|nr:hypothetical protein [Natronosalvus vescus]